MLPEAEIETTRLKGCIVVQRGQMMFVGAMEAGTVVRQCRIDTFDPTTNKGYQRERMGARVRAAAHYYAQGGRFPNPLLANIRTEDFHRVRLGTDEDRDGINEAVHSKGDWIGSGWVDLPVDVPLWLYDGQHREGGLDDLVSASPGFRTFPVPVSITLGLDDSAEMNEFYQVNTNAKPVKTDLAWELLRQRAAADPDLRHLLDEKGQEWIIKGQEVVEELVELEGPWREAIQRPNQRRTRADRITIPQAQFVRSLKPVLDMPLLAKGEASTIAKIVDAYWKGIATVLPEPFDPGNSPKNWVIQKGPGAIALHRVLPQVIEVMRARGAGLAEVDGYAQVMARLPTLTGQSMTEDGETKDVTGADFWKSGSEGVASTFTGDAGRKRLAVMIQVLLPRPSSELRL